jgi:hypothetical protein
MTRADLLEQSVDLITRSEGHSERRLLEGVFGEGRRLAARKSLPWRYPDSKHRKIFPKSGRNSLVRDGGVGDSNPLTSTNKEICENSVCRSRSVSHQDSSPGSEWPALQIQPSA